MPVSRRFIPTMLASPAEGETPSGTLGRWMVRWAIRLVARPWISIRRPRTHGLPISQYSGNPSTGTNRISSNQAEDAAGRRPSGTAPIAAIFNRYSVTRTAPVMIAVQLTSRVRVGRRRATERFVPRYLWRGLP